VTIEEAAREISRPGLAGQLALDRQLLFAEPDADVWPADNPNGLMADEHRNSPAESNGPVLAASLVKLLDTACKALANEHPQVSRLIARASALIRAEIEKREAERFSPCGSLTHRHLAPWQSRRVLEFIQAHLGDTIRIEDLARAASVGPTYFSRAFRLDFGEPPYAFVIRRRIELAQEMMLTTDEPLAAIAVACGLADQAHLTRTFQRLVGSSPANWRRSRRLPPTL
jgi:AraC family transcriptional regulator